MSNIPENGTTTEMETAPGVDVKHLKHILEIAITHNSFGRMLADMSMEQKQALKPLLNEAYNNLVPSIPKHLLSDPEAQMTRLASEKRNQLVILFGEQQYYKDLPRPVKYIHKLMKELLIACDEYDGEVQYQNSDDGYIGDFFIYLQTRPSSVLNGVSTDSMKYVIIGDTRQPPTIYTGGRIQISSANPFDFATNLAYIQENLAEAKRLTHEIEAMPKGKRPRII